ncbi:TIGR04282 family arsenosugar biosynthesis glycosyltransferase [Psychrobacter sp. FBL11]|uniref:TIGR04282 family arsenosugar biosynthesis glycosyltransferase n=1 Tax=Psychrobacter saeujeotis TaxID=3143436 RepID=A0ABU9X500_9GAMM|nr:TIGR04282 family arsenosugar biosynthesis glycosyltransferase [uncultured Psychrobacter sp.]
MIKDTLVVIFAKFPAEGKAKTRLQPALGMAGAARIARKLLLHSIEQALATGFTVELCVSPAPSDPCWQTLNLPGSVQWSAQVEGDLGTRMLTASQQALATLKQVILIGTDCPSLNTSQIRQAVRHLETSDSVMIPAFDGGYVLFGFKQAYASLFANIEWSTASVASITQQRIKDLNWSLASLAPLPDIDEPTDLKYLPVGWLDGYRMTNS